MSRSTMTELEFDPLDQEFLGSEAIVQETMKAIAGLELDKHRLRMQVIVNGDVDSLTPNGTTYAEEIEKVDTAIEKLKDAFGHILYPHADNDD